MELLPDQQQAYQEEQQVRVHAWQIDAEPQATQRQDELTGERATPHAQLPKLHRRKAALGTERAATINLIKARAQARAIAAAINREGMLRPTFARASQNVAVAVALLDTLPEPSTDRVDRLYCQLKGILGVAAEQQAENSLQRWAEVSVSSPGGSKASQQRTAAGTTSSAP
jgi:hypothetical protein